MHVANNLFFYPEYGSDIFLLNVGSQRTTRRCVLEDNTIRNHRLEKLKSCKVTSTQLRGLNVCFRATLVQGNSKAIPVSGRGGL
jgi:hypothetical protein